jgi:hypothetical protein
VHVAGRLDVFWEEAPYLGFAMRWLVAALCGSSLACGDSMGPRLTSGLVRIKPAASVYQPGATVGLTITNLSRQKLVYSPCFYHLERQSQDEWHLVYEDQNPCLAVLEHLEPFATRQTSVTLPDNLEFAPHRARFPSIGARRGDPEEFIPAAQVGDSFVIQR